MIPVIHRSDPWIYMEICGYLWSVSYIWTTLMGAAGTTHQCTAALFKLVELNNFTPSVDKNTLWWIWTRIYWNTIISLAFPLILVWLYYFTIYQFTKWTMSHFWLECHTKIILVLNKLTNLSRRQWMWQTTHIQASKNFTVVVFL